MEEILASIRRILNEEEPANTLVGGKAEPPRLNDDVLVLDHSMLVPTLKPLAVQPEPAEAAAAAPAVAEPAVAEPDDIWPEAAGPEAAEPEPVQPEPIHVSSAAEVVAQPVAVEPVADPQVEAAEPSTPPPGPELSPACVTTPAAAVPAPTRFFGHTLVAPETAAATASSVDGLLRTLAASRATQVYRGGPTIEDVVRDELRPLLKQWLDEHLPPLVERLVRTEIERVVGRAVP